MTDPLAGMIGRPLCWLFGHELSDPTWLTARSAYHDCERCKGQFVRMHHGEFAGAMLPWDEDARRMFSGIGYRRDIPARCGRTR